MEHDPAMACEQDSFVNMNIIMRDPIPHLDMPNILKGDEGTMYSIGFSFNWTYQHSHKDNEDVTNGMLFNLTFLPLFHK